MFEKYVDVLPEVEEALASGKAVVALESTIISHGMPYPRNVETAKNVEDIIREEGAVPATIGIIGGRIKIGLTGDELEFMGRQEDILKVSRRDLPVVVSKKMNGATTVATTMICAAMGGIKVFVTGGIGGVHKGAQETFDISADLTELANTDVAVVCAGVKSILDIGLTLEYLETQGVPVLAYKTGEFPAFYTAKSGFMADYRIDSPADMAGVMKAKWDLGLKGGLVLGNPVPEDLGMDEAVINEAISKALKEAEELGVKGKETTPFLLSRIKDITGGDSLDSNIELVYNNARVGARIALEFAKLG
ncbi:pseudouridine-5'-phosphate glycosidase [Dethiosulfatibacter aminovorans]|uniref:pseudouridine-5'-phosphate glycosidase n=1 Tax=Dethiosulfatibacter aminovorans TaxID=332095 RepID=UPI000933B547|nr:pseudouridine-5'-phosphate glycosidase [Dethiosulfatibacter aminovorans]